MIAPGVLGVKIVGRLDSMSSGNIWRETELELDKTSPKRVIVDASEIGYCDGSGIGYLFGLRQRQKKGGGDLEIRGLQTEFQQLLDLYDPSEFEELPEIQPVSISFFEKIRRLTCQSCEEVYAFVEFVGEAGVALVKALLSPKQVRWKDALLVAETAQLSN
jgi:anti-anti-sigma regulatory factor